MTGDERGSGLRRLLGLPPSAARVARDVEDEIRHHLACRVDELVARGVPPDAAREQAAREYGDVAESRRELSEVDRRRVGRGRRAASLEALGQDLHFAARGIRRQPGFALAVVVVLALGIGANATMFGLVDRMLLRPPAHVAEPSRLVSFSLDRRLSDGGRDDQDAMSYPMFRDLRDLSGGAFSQVAAYTVTTLPLGRGADARKVRGMRATSGYFAALGARPLFGRAFVPEDDGNPTGTQVAVLGYGFWQRQLAGDPGVLGRELELGDRRYTVVGVMPEHFTGLGQSAIDVWVPLTAGITAVEHASWLDSRYAFWLRIVGRLAPGVTRERAAAQATAALRANETPERLERSDARAGLTSVEPREARRDSPDAKVAVLLGAVSLLVLLIACANVANLQLARALRRRREIAVRLALGIGRARLVRQLLTEGVLLALVGGVAAVGVAYWGGQWVRGVLFENVTFTDAPLDLRVLTYAMGAALLTGVVAGLAPAVMARGGDLAGTLRSGTRGGAPRSRARMALVVVQAALTIVLLVGTGLFSRSLERVRDLPLGMEPDSVLAVGVSSSGTTLTTAETMVIYDRLLAHVRGLPTVQSAALGISLPFASGWAESVSVPGRDSLPMTKAGGPYFNAVTHEFFATTGVRLLRGRVFTEADRRGSAPVVVVNRTLADMWWPNEDAVGKCMRVGGDTMPCAEVVGVVENTRRFSVIEDEAAQFYLPLGQEPAWVTSRVLFVRPTGDPDRAVQPLRRELQTALPGLPYVDVTAMSEVVSPQLRSWRLGASMFGAFGLLALVLAAVGLYSVLAYDVAQRTHEIGVRQALGAGRGLIARLIMGAGLRTVIVGGIVGALAALAAGRFVAPLLFETSPRDPAVFMTVGALLIAVAMLATLLPAWRATRVDPAEALRAE